MSGVDKANEMEELEGKGWTESPEDGPYHMKPPKELFEALAKKAFYVYDAKEIQSIADFLNEKSSQ